MIDTSVQLNNHNSYHATENYWCTLYGVQTQSYVTVSFAVYATSAQSAKNLVKLRFYSETGAIVSESSHMFAVDTIWERVSVTSQVPTTAKNMQICFLSGSYWWAEPKAEGGEIATAYSTNTAGALTWMTANGIYTGTITASQVILSNNDPLDNRLATLNSNMLKLNSDINSTNADITEIKAGQAVFVKASDLANAGKTTINGSNITTGTISAARIGANSITASKLNVTTLSSITSNLGAITGGSLNIGNGTFKVTSSGALTATSADIKGKITATSGSIGALSIGANEIKAGSGSNTFAIIHSASHEGAFYSGGTNWDNSTFAVYKNGKVWATNADIKGKITATSGSIGALSIGADEIKAGSGSSTFAIIHSASHEGAFYSGGANWANSTFAVYKNGKVWAKNAEIAGKVTSNSSSSLGGSLNYTGGYLSSVGGSYNGSINSNGYFGGSLSSAGGSFYGSTYSTSGRLGNATFSAPTAGNLRFGGGVYATSFSADYSMYAQAFHKTSDVRLKDDVSNLSKKEATNLIKTIKPVKYKFKNESNYDYGVLAQDLIQDLDADTADIFVKPTPEGYFSVDYTSLQMATIPVIQDLLERVERLEDAGTINL